jgi:hypothetical protein
MSTEMAVFPPDGPGGRAARPWSLPMPSVSPVFDQVFTAAIPGQMAAESTAYVARRDSAAAALADAAETVRDFYLEFGGTLPGRAGKCGRHRYPGYHRSRASPGAVRDRRARGADRETALALAERIRRQSEEISVMTDLNRREFIHRSVKAGMVSAAALGVGWWRTTGVLRPWSHPPSALSGIPDFSRGTPGDGPAMAIARGTDRADMVRRTLGALGGMNRFVRPGDRVVIKVNAAFASPPAISATSHPDLVRRW